MKPLASLLLLAVLLVLVLRSWETAARTEAAHFNANSVVENPQPDPVALELESRPDKSERVPAAPKPAADPAGQEPETATALLRVTVLDEDGEGVFEAYVSLTPTDEQIARTRNEGTKGIATVSARTDSNGLAELEAPPGEERSLNVGKLRTTSIELVDVEALAPGEVRELIITVRTRTDAELVGRVVDAQNGSPIGGVAVHVTRSAGLSISSRAKPLLAGGDPDAITSGDGVFRIPLRTWEATFGTFVAPGWSPLRAKLRVDPDSSVEDFEVRLSRACRITGSVTGAPPGGLQVSAVTPGYHLFQGEGGVMLSGGNVTFTVGLEADGTFTLEDLPSNVPLELQVESGRTTLLQEPQPVTLAPETTHVVTWTLGQGGLLRGRVVDPQGAPVAEQEVWLLLASEAQPGFLATYREPTYRTRSDVQGRFEFSKLQPGTWTVGLAPRDRRRADDDGRHAHAPFAVGVTIPESGAAEVELTLHRGLHLEGLLLDAEGRPFRGGVRASAVGFRGYQYENTGADGRFRIGPLVPGTYWLAGSAHQAPLLADSEPVEALAGDAGIELRLQTGGALSGSAVDDLTGQPAPAKFDLTWGADGFRGVSSSPPKADFQFNGLQADTYRVIATTEDGRIGQVEALDVTLGVELEGVVVRVQAAGFLKLRYAGPAEYAQFVVIQNGASLKSDGLRTGLERRLTVPVGSITIRLRAHDYSANTTPLPLLFEHEQTVHIEVGAETEVVFEIPD